MEKLAPSAFTNSPARFFSDTVEKLFSFTVVTPAKPIAPGVDFTFAAEASRPSAAAPTFAGFVSLLNAARLAAGLPPLGFLNPLVYAVHAVAPGAFNDIAVGNNPGCGTPGFNATAGWDAVTGVGTPNFGKLKDIVTFGLGSLPGFAN